MSDSQTYNERELLSRIAEGDERAFRSLFDSYSVKLRPYLWKVTRSANDTEDIIQETFIKLWLHRDKLGIIENLGGYIYRTAARTTLNHLRAALNRDKKMIELGLLSRPSAEQSAPTPSRFGFSKQGQGIDPNGSGPTNAPTAKDIFPQPGSRP